MEILTNKWECIVLKKLQENLETKFSSFDRQAIIFKSH